MANFVHAQPRPLWTDCNQILHVGSGGRCDHWCQVLWKLVKGFWSYRTPPNAISYSIHLYLTFIALTTVSALPCCTVIAAKPLQMKTWLLLTAYRKMPWPYPMVLSPTPYDLSFSHNTSDTDDRQTTEDTSCHIHAFSIAVARQKLNWIHSFSVSASLSLFFLSVSLFVSVSPLARLSVLLQRTLFKRQVSYLLLSRCVQFADITSQSSFSVLSAAKRTRQNKTKLLKQ